MNKKVLWSMIVLLWVFLIGFSVIKLFFADWFVAVVENERIVQIGNFIDTHLYARLLADVALSVLTLHFYLCACKKVWSLSLRWYITVVIYAATLNVCYLYMPYLAMSLDLIGLVVLPLLMQAERKQTIAVFILHQIAQPLTLIIRSAPLYLVDTNYATQFVLIFDLYVWLTLYYLHSNLYKEESLWERLACPFLEIRQKLNSRKKSKE